MPEVPEGLDGRDRTPERCVNCRGDCTKLYVCQTYGLPAKNIYTCKDRRLCAEIMIMEHSIANVRSA